MRVTKEVVQRPPEYGYALRMDEEEAKFLMMIFCNILDGSPWAKEQVDSVIWGLARQGVDKSKTKLDRPMSLP
jgi:hypothetical protein